MTQSLHAEVIDLLTYTVIDYRKVVIELAKQHPATFVKLVKEANASVTNTSNMAPFIGCSEPVSTVSHYVHPDKWMEGVHLDMAAGRKVEAIKAIRTATGKGLKEAKDIADNVQNLLGARYTSLSYYDNAARLQTADAVLASAIARAR